MASVSRRAYFVSQRCLYSFCSHAKPTQTRQFSSSQTKYLRVRPRRVPVQLVERNRSWRAEEESSAPGGTHLEREGNEDPPHSLSRNTQTTSTPQPTALTRTPRTRNQTNPRQQNHHDELIPSPPSSPQKRKQNSRPVPSPSTAVDGIAWYWETLPPTPKQIQDVTQYFHHATQNARFLTSVANFRNFPHSDVPEIAFLGRSNVGKSSLLNALLNQDKQKYKRSKDIVLARTSSKPGFTKTMNLYGLGPGNGVIMANPSSRKDGSEEKRGKEGARIVGHKAITIVDTPGYGEASLEEWGTEVLKYIQNRKQLRRVFVIIDAEHGLKDKDRSILAMLRLAGVQHQVVLSKVDRVWVPEGKKAQRYDGVNFKRNGSLEALHETMAAIRPEIQPPYGGAALGEMLAFSSYVAVNKERFGIGHIRFAVLKAAGYM